MFPICCLVNVSRCCGFCSAPKRMWSSPRPTDVLHSLWRANGGHWASGVKSVEPREGYLRICYDMSNVLRSLGSLDWVKGSWWKFFYGWNTQFDGETWKNLFPFFLESSQRFLSNRSLMVLICLDSYDEYSQTGWVLRLFQLGAIIAKRW